MKLAVTGASGFVGRAVVAEPLRAGAGVTAMLRPGKTLPAEAGPVKLAHLDINDPPADAWARLFYLHGEGQTGSSLYPLLRSAVQRGDARFPMSGSEQLRDYLPVDAAAHTLARLALARADHGVLNVGSGAPVSVRRLVEGWIEANLWPITPELGRLPYPPHEPMAFWGDTTKLRHCQAAA